MECVQESMAIALSYDESNLIAIQREFEDMNCVTCVHRNGDGCVMGCCREYPVEG